MEYIFEGRPIQLPARYVVNAGYAGRDQASVKAHIDELAAIGVAVPGRVPTFYPVPALQLTQAEAIQVGHGQTSAEVEYVLLIWGGRRYITVGSDHSDRALEAYSVNAAKQMCPNIVADTVWDYEAVRGRLDQLMLRCHVLEDGAWRLYQEGPVTDLLSPEQLLELGRPVVPQELDGLVLYSGTLPTIGAMTFGSHWRVSLHDELTGETITKAYTVEALPPCID